MIKRYCDQCGVHTLHDQEGFCTVCFPVERRLELLRESHPEVGDGDYANELLEDDGQPTKEHFLLGGDKS